MAQNYKNNVGRPVGSTKVNRLINFSIRLDTKIIEELTKISIKESRKLPDQIRFIFNNYIENYNK